MSDTADEIENKKYNKKILGSVIGSLVVAATIFLSDLSFTKWEEVGTNTIFREAHDSQLTMFINKDSVMELDITDLNEDISNIQQTVQRIEISVSKIDKGGTIELGRLETRLRILIEDLQTQLIIIGGALGSVNGRIDRLTYEKERLE